MNNITVDNICAWFFVNTIHGNTLEFVLDDTQERLGLEHSYYEKLENMLKHEFQSSDVRVEEISVYYHISFNISAPTYPQLEKALVRCDKVVQRWINKYHINQMTYKRG